MKLDAYVPLRETKTYAFNNYQDKKSVMNNSTISFKGLNVSEISKGASKLHYSKVVQEVLRILEETKTSVRSFFIKFKRTNEIPYRKQPLVAFETYQDVENAANSGNKVAKATKRIIDSLHSSGFPVDEDADLFTDKFKIKASAAKDLAKDIMNTKDPQQGLDLITELNGHIDATSDVLSQDTDYLTKLKNHIPFETDADKTFNPENRTNLTYQSMRFSEKFPKGSIYNEDRQYVLQHADSLGPNDIVILQEHPEFLDAIKTINPDAAKKLIHTYPQLIDPKPSHSGLFKLFFGRREDDIGQANLGDLSDPSLLLANAELPSCFKSVVSNSIKRTKIEAMANGLPTDSSCLTDRPVQFRESHIEEHPINNSSCDNHQVINYNDSDRAAQETGLTQEEIGQSNLTEDNNGNEIIEQNESSPLQTTDDFGEEHHVDPKLSTNEQVTPDDISQIDEQASPFVDSEDENHQHFWLDDDNSTFDN